MLEIDGLISIAVLGLWIFALVDVITTDASQVRNLEKTWWVVIVLLFSVVGSLIWLVAGRPQKSGTGLPDKGNTGSVRSSGAMRGRPPAPDDDPEFLALVSKQNVEDKELLQSWEDDLRKREEDPTAP